MKIPFANKLNHRKNIILIISILFSLSACLSNNKSETSKENPFLADPTIFCWEGVYYLYGTGGNLPNKTNVSNEGFLVYTSTDLKNWERPTRANDGFALKKGDAYGTQGFWAPQVFHYKDKFYMAYTANEQIAIATADNPLGPFKQDELKPISTLTRQIDPFVFFDDDGKVYMYHVRLIEGNRLFVAEMNDDLSGMIESTLTECIDADAGTWEDTENVDWKVAEGPTIIKENGQYYFFYSANDFRNIDYAVGYATSDSPYGPWMKSKQNPMIDRYSVKKNGSGHGDLFVDKEGKMYYVLHTHFSDEKVAPRRTAIVQVKQTKNEFKIDHKTFRFLNLK